MISKSTKIGLNPFFSFKKILITGASGFLSHSILRELYPIECSVVQASRWGAFPERPAVALCEVRNVRADLACPHFWREVLPGTDVVFHLASQTSVSVADQNPLEDWNANVLPMLRLLEACRETGLSPMIVFAGSATQCGLAERLPVDELVPDRPVTVYDLHKLAAEGYLEHYCRQGWARGTTLRLANVYGPGPKSSKADRGILNLMMRRALNGEAITIFGEGAVVRDYVHVQDVARAFLLAAAHPDSVSGRHFLVGSGEGHSIAQAFELVAERAGILAGRRAEVRKVSPPPGLSPIEDRNFTADITALRAATGWQPAIGLREGIDQTLHTFLS